MNIALHTPNGTVVINSDTITDTELQELGMSREILLTLIPFNAEKEIKDLKTKLKDKGILTEEEAK